MQQPDIRQLLQLLQSPAVQQLVQFLKTNGGSAAQDAASRAASGDLSAAQNSLTPLLQDSRLQALLKQLGNANE